MRACSHDVNPRISDSFYRGSRTIISIPFSSHTSCSFCALQTITMVSSEYVVWSGGYSTVHYRDDDSTLISHLHLRAIDPPYRIPSLHPSEPPSPYQFNDYCNHSKIPVLSTHIHIPYLVLTATSLIFLRTFKDSHSQSWSPSQTQLVHPYQQYQPSQKPPRSHDPSPNPIRSVRTRENSSYSLPLLGCRSW